MIYLDALFMFGAGQPVMVLSERLPSGPLDIRIGRDHTGTVLSLRIDGRERARIEIEEGDAQALRAYGEARVIHGLGAGPAQGKARIATIIGERT